MKPSCACWLNATPSSQAWPSTWGRGGARGPRYSSSSALSPAAGFRARALTPLTPRLLSTGLRWQAFHVAPCRETSRRIAKGVLTRKRRRHESFGPPADEPRPFWLLPRRDPRPSTCPGARSLLAAGLVDPCSRRFHCVRARFSSAAAFTPLQPKAPRPRLDGQNPSKRPPAQIKAAVSFMPMAILCRSKP